MPIVKGLCPGELYRIRWCQGCRFLGSLGGYGYCDYFLNHEHRRPCKFGLGCTVKELDSDPGKIEAFVKRTVERYDKIQSAKIAIRVKWDVKKAKAMWEKDVKADIIAEAVGSTRKSVTDYAYKHGWRRSWRG